MQQQIRRAAERRVHDHRVVNRGVGDDVAHVDAALRSVDAQRARIARAMSSQTGWPDGASAECGSDMPKRFADHLRRGGGAEKLAAAAGRSASAAAEIRGFLERDQAVRKTRADRSAPRPRPRRPSAAR